MNRRILILIIFLSFCTIMMAQQDKPIQDSTIQDSLVYKTIDQPSEKIIEDSTKYKAIEAFSKKSKFTGFLHKILFRQIIKEKLPPVEKEARKLTSNEGKIIRRIQITTLDPFGYNLSDTSVQPEIFPLKAGNSLHVKTKPLIIKNLLLFKENERFDSLRIKESARLVRSQKYIRDIFLDVLPASRDSVDIHIRVSDVWSIVPSYQGTSSVFGLGISDFNFVGLGNNFVARSLWKKPGNENITHLKYLMPNIRNSYISLNVQYLFSLNKYLPDIMDFDPYFYSPDSYTPEYMFSPNRNIIKSIEVVRPFYSPVTRWAGGIFVGQVMTTQSYLNLDSVKYVSSLTNILDYWIGRSWQINKRVSPGERITSLVLSGRMVRTRNPERSAEAINANLFSTHTYYFGNISISSRKYLLDRYIFNYGKIEDVPVGRIFGVTVGIDSQQKSRYYLGLNAGWGSYYQFGYLSTHLTYGTFKGQGGFQQGTLTGRIDYYTRLLSAGKWKLRQFVRPSFIFGINRFPADNQPLKVGIKGFESIESGASHIIVLSLQTQSYAPWDLAGFRFGPYIFTHLGLLGEEPPGKMKSSRFYSLLGLGVLIKNDYLMFNTFQISVSFYPFIPSRGYNIFRTNAYKTSDYGFRDFEVSKPGIFD